MPSSSAHLPRLLALALLAGGSAFAQPVQPGFLVERLSGSAAGAGWVMVDDLDMRGDLGAAVAFSLGYAHAPLRLQGEGGPLSVVEHQAGAVVGLAVTWQRLRLSVDLPSPIATSGQGGTVEGITVTAPRLDLSSHPDWVSDTRVGLDARLWGEAGAKLRLGLAAHAFFPNGSRALYDSDGTWRGVVKVLAAGDAGWLTWAGHVGVHLRPLDTGMAGGPRGNELLVAAAGGAKTRLGADGAWALVVGPELFGATALQALLRDDATALEGLLSARLEGTGTDGPQVRVRLGVGAGLHARFGAPEWRAVVGVEWFGHATVPPAQAPVPGPRG